MKANLNEFVICQSDNGSMLGYQEKVWSEHTDVPVNFFFGSTEDPLFSARNYIDAIMTGFLIAKRGYDKITVRKEPWRRL